MLFLSYFYHPLQIDGTRNLFARLNPLLRWAAPRTSRPPLVTEVCLLQIDSPDVPPLRRRYSYNGPHSIETDRRAGNFEEMHP